MKTATAQQRPPRADEVAPAAVRCPYCRDDLRSEVSPSSAAPVLCLDCETPHHAECFREHRGCTQLGCSSREAMLWTPEAPSEQGFYGMELAMLGVSLWFGILAGFFTMPTRCGW